ncbi:PQQ-binding-like beta-propeller repeat protein [Cellulomonas cellasea]|uniref:Outer membrane protein assembly factor BamB n=1 Tax=Cellulomonas cellasea TaxID=43670 RepID=A0A7W4UH01_9CELL|nr:PQQ-binding-like beta-propeller repeat protein [Cellulomonas cellasea]MBB2923480.1 outer membrane protein assembly factor BamB [Cellulomonas cellasea]
MRGELTPVELVEDEAPTTTGASAPTRRGWGERVRQVPGRVWWTVAVLVVVVAASAVVAQAQARADREERLAQIARAGPPLGTPLVAAWHVDARSVLGFHGDLVIATGPDDGLLGIDVRDGAVRWRRVGAGDAGTCRLTPRPTDPSPVGREQSTTGGAVPVLLICENRRAATPSERGAAVIVLDPATGEVERTVRLDMALLTSVVTEDALAGIARDEAGYVLAAGWSLLTGEKLWSYRSTRPHPDGWLGNQGTSFWADADGLYAVGRDWAVGLDPATGEALAAGPAGAAGDQQLDRFTALDGTVVEVVHRDGEVRTEARGPDGGTRWTRDTHAVRSLADDGTAGGLLLTARDGTGAEAVDLRTGERIWASDEIRLFGLAGPLVLSGLVIASTGHQDDAGLVALDADTGRVVWRTAEEDGAPGSELFTDGARVLVLGEVDGALHLVARDVRTGAVAWRTAVPPDSTDVQLLPDRTVLVGGRTGLTAFRPAVRSERSAHDAG